METQQVDGACGTQLAEMPAMGEEGKRGGGNDMWLLREVNCNIPYI
jgi:hypothetical protein